MLESQSKTVSLSQLPDAQAPLFLQPNGRPFIEVEQELQLIIYFLFLYEKVNNLFGIIKNLMGKYTQYCQIKKLIAILTLHL
jgi:hypothetical protein